MSEEKKIFTTEIYVEMTSLNDLYNVVQNKVIKKHLNTCDRKNGYITSIDRDSIKLIDNIINIADSSVLYTVEFSCVRLKPNIDDIVIGTVKNLQDYGILVDVNGVYKIMISSKKMNGYKHNSKDNVYKKGRKKISIGDVIKVRIENIRFHVQVHEDVVKKDFQCTGALC